MLAVAFGFLGTPGFIVGTFRVNGRLDAAASGRFEVAKIPHDRFPAGREEPRRRPRRVQAERAIGDCRSDRGKVLRTSGGPDGRFGSATDWSPDPWRASVALSRSNLIRSS
jgi:hypothetical protein